MIGFNKRPKEVLNALNPDEYPLKHWTKSKWDWERAGWGWWGTFLVILSLVFIGLIGYGFYLSWVNLGTWWTLLIILGIIVIPAPGVIRGFNVRRVASKGREGS